MIDKADEMSAENSTAVNFCVFNIRDDHQMHLFVRFEQIYNSDILLRDFILSHVTSLPSLYSMYGFDYVRGTISVKVYLEVSADNVTTFSAGCMTVGGQVLTNGTIVLLLDGRYRRQSMRQRHAEGDVRWIQEHILVCFICPK